VTALHARVPLTLHDPSPRVLAASLKKLQALFARDVEKKRISSEDGEAAMSRIKGVEGSLVGGGAGLEGDTDLVIEVSSPHRYSPWQSEAEAD
jgi:3-hydroxybutyryl-CoA dehydrogenase